MGCWKSLNRRYDLKTYDRVRLIGFGKASLPMAEAAYQILGKSFTDGLVITKHENYQNSRFFHSKNQQPFTILSAGHPVPDEGSLKAGSTLNNFLSGCQINDLVISLISGGGSSLVVSPVPGVSLGDLQELTHLMLKCGAPIREINTLRKHLELLKGGGMAQLARNASKIVLILSDVVGDLLDVIASGPFVPDPSTYENAWNILARYKLIDIVPPIIRNHLLSGVQGKIPETAKPGESAFQKLQTVIVGSNYQAAQSALLQAKIEGFQSLILTTNLQGEARQAGRFLGSILREIATTGHPLPRPACIIAGGETTVTVRGGGKGGRNSEMALSAVEELAGLQDIALVTFATDGGDGPTDAAGAVVTGETYKEEFKPVSIYLGLLSRMIRIIILIG